MATPREQLPTSRVQDDPTIQSPLFQPDRDRIKREPVGEVGQPSSGSMIHRYGDSGPRPAAFLGQNPVGGIEPKESCGQYSSLAIRIGHEVDGGFVVDSEP